MPDVVIGDPLSTSIPSLPLTATLVTLPEPEDPVDAAVILPCWSTVILAKVYEPGVTAVSAK